VAQVAHERGLPKNLLYEAALKKPASG
jgi:hypothetical protein